MHTHTHTHTHTQSGLWSGRYLVAYYISPLLYLLYCTVCVANYYETIIRIRGAEESRV